MARVYASTACPSCGIELVPPPRAKKQGVVCHEWIWVRTDPAGETRLLREADLDAFEQVWAEHLAQRDAAEDAQRRAETSAMTREALASFIDLGVRHIELLVANDACPTCRRWSGRPIGISIVPPIPIPGCTREICRCDYLPMVE